MKTNFTALKDKAKKTLREIKFSKEELTSIGILLALLFVGVSLINLAPEYGPVSKSELAAANAAFDKLKAEIEAASKDSKAHSLTQAGRGLDTKNAKRITSKEGAQKASKRRKRINAIININDRSLEPKALDKVPYIGKVLSARIIKYRNLLGGFYSQDQFKEVYGLRGRGLENLRKATLVDKALIRKVNINALQKKSFWKLPYLTEEEKTQLFSHIQSAHPLKKLEEVYGCKNIDSGKLRKVLPYMKLSN